jgi:hypothetical protein
MSDEIISTHLHNVRSLINVISETNNILSRHPRFQNLENNSNQNSNQENDIENIWSHYLMQLLNQRRPNHNEVLFRFDTHIPTNFDLRHNINNSRNTNNNRQSNLDSFNILHINSDNSYNLYQANSYNEHHYHLYDITDFSFIQNPINDICPITRERFYENQNVMMIKQCRHVFNKSSLNIWLRNNNTCPACRCSIIHS